MNCRDAVSPSLWEKFLACLWKVFLLVFCTRDNLFCFCFWLLFSVTVPGTGTGTGTGTGSGSGYWVLGTLGTLWNLSVCGVAERGGGKVRTSKTRLFDAFGVIKFYIVAVAAAAAGCAAGVAAGNGKCFGVRSSAPSRASAAR